MLVEELEGESADTDTVAQPHIPGATEADGLTDAPPAALAVANPLPDATLPYAVVRHNTRFGWLRRLSGNIRHWLWS